MKMATYRRIRHDIIDKYWDEPVGSVLDDKVTRICKKLSKRINKGQKSQIDTLGNMLLRCHD